MNTSDSQRDFLSDTASSSSTDHDGLTISSFNSSDNLEDDVFVTDYFKPDKEDTIEVRKSKIISEIISGTSGDFVKKIRSLSDSDQRMSERPIRARLASDPYSACRRDPGNCQRSLSRREPREIEFLKTAEMAQRYLDDNMAQQEDVWKKRSSSGGSLANERHTRMPRSPVIHQRSEVTNNLVNIQDAASLGFPNDRSQADADERYVLGCTYALIRQPEPQNTYLKLSSDNTVFTGQGINQRSGILLRTMSEPNQGLGKKEFSSSEEKEKDERTVTFQEVDVVGSLRENTRHEGSKTPGVRRAQTLPRMPKRPLTSFTTTKNWKDNELRTRKAANDFLQNINNSTVKSQQERVDVVEKAFEWIRKEVADLRAQDKDIMRMFTKIQAGIRHIKSDQTSLMESEEDFISTPDLTRTSTSSSSNDDSSVHRRASLL